MKKIIFDVETNGLFDCSVLSFSALLLDSKDNIIDIVDRFYYRLEDEIINAEALKINQLYDDVIAKKRENVSYPKHFYLDKEILTLLQSADLLIAHNIEFDLGHISKAFNVDFRDKKTFCTMKETQYLYEAPYYKSNGEPKYPRLSESLEYCKVNADELRKKLDLDFHNSLFDVYCCYEIYKFLKQ